MADAVVPIPNVANWPLAKFGDICSLVSRGSAPVYVERSEVRAIGQRCVAAAGFDALAARPHSERSMGRVLQPEYGDVLLNSTGTGTIGRSCVFADQGRFIVDGHVTVMRTEPSRANGTWLHALLRTPWAQTFLETQCYSGSTNQVELSRSRLVAGRLPVPPLLEQRQIAAVLDTIDDGIRKTEEIIAKLKQVKQGLLHDLLTRGIDDNGELRDPERHPEQFKDSPLGRIPRDWTASVLDSLLESSVDGPFGSNLKSEHYVEGPGVRLVRLQNIGEGTFLDHEKAWISDSHARSLAKHDVRPGDVLVASLGDPTHAFARSCVYPVNHPPGIVKADCFRLRTGDRLLSGFLAHILNTPRWRRGLAGLVHRSGVSRDRVNLSKVRRLLVPVAPVAEQQVIVATLAATTLRVESETNQLAKFVLLKAGLMEDLLTGRVRVTRLLEKAAE